MATKYILHGGYTRAKNSDNNNFFKEILSETKGKILILLVYFATEDTNIKKFAKQEKENFLRNSKNKNLVFEIADKNNFNEQVKKADVIYIRGGKTEKLLAILNNFNNLKKLFKNKIIAGSSAGVYALVKYYFNRHNEGIKKGLNFVNIKAICHYSSKKKKALEKLSMYKENLPIITLPDYKHIVLFE